MPFDAMASAAARTTASLTLQAKWFQLFQPMGGVSASPGSCAGSGPPRLQRATAATKACPTQRTLLLLIITLLRKDVCKMVDGRAKDWKDVRSKVMGMISEAFLWREYQFQSELHSDPNFKPSLVLQKWTGLLHDGDTLITFNWDVLHESALWRAGKWHYADGY